MGKVTICVECKHHLLDPNASTKCGPHPDTWFWHKCRAKSPRVGFNLVTGKSNPIDYPYCRDKNLGDCSYWEPK